MGWPEVALALINVLQVVALAWITRQQAVTKHEVERINGELTAALEATSSTTQAPR